MIKALELPLDTNIEPLYRYLQSRGIQVSVSEEAGKQVIYVSSEEMVKAVQDATQRYLGDDQIQRTLSDWQRGRADQESDSTEPPVWYAYPVVMGLLASLLITALWTGFGEFESHRYFLIVDHYRYPFPHLGNPLGGLQATFESGEWWRFISPSWLHWGVLHWLFNSLGLWIFGRSLEKCLGHTGLLGVVFISALASNLSQYFVSGPGFAGFSGVTYALIGAHAAGLFLAPRAPYWQYPSLVAISVVWMAAGALGITDYFGMHLANMAHFVGFIVGFIWLGVLLKWRDTKHSDHSFSGSA